MGNIPLGDTGVLVEGRGISLWLLGHRDFSSQTTTWGYFTLVSRLKNLREPPGGEEGDAGGQHHFLRRQKHLTGGVSLWLYLPDNQGFHEEIQFVLFRTHLRQRLGTEGEGGKEEEAVSRRGKRVWSKS